MKKTYKKYFIYIQNKDNKKILYKNHIIIIIRYYILKNIL